MGALLAAVVRFLVFDLAREVLKTAVTKSVEKWIAVKNRVRRQK